MGADYSFELNFIETHAPQFFGRNNSFLGSVFNGLPFFQCYNRGFDGQDVQWECKADMDNLYRFGSVEVVCEGYDYPDDPYILKGSCGLEYTLELTKEGQNKNQGIIQFQFFDTIGLTNLSNARYCTPHS